MTIVSMCILATFSGASKEKEDSVIIA